MAGPFLGVSAALRPLTIAEMLDRAVTFAVRFFPLLALIYALFALPLTVLEYFGTADSAKAFSAMLDAIARAGHGASQAQILKAFTITPVFNGFTVAYLILALLGGPLALGAGLCAAARITSGDAPPTLAEAYRTGLRAWPALVGTELLWIACAVAVYAAFIVAFVVGAIGVGLLTIFSKWFALVVGLILVVPASLAFLLAVLMGVLAAYVSFLTVVVERKGAVAGFTAGFERVFRRSFWRSVRVALAVFAIDMGVALIGLFGQGILFGLLRNGALGTIFGAIIDLMAAVFTALFLAAFYYDVRVRTEGFDLQAEAALVGGVPVS
jgi:hypothetical protein